MPADAGAEAGLMPYPERVRKVLEALFGKGGAEAVLYYTGEPDPSSFEEKLRKVLGGGAEMVIQEITTTPTPIQK